MLKSKKKKMKMIATMSLALTEIHSILTQKCLNPLKHLLILCIHNGGQQHFDLSN